MPPEVSRRWACNRCHALKSRCTTPPGSVSCERCFRLEIPCEYSRRRQCTSSGPNSGADFPRSRDAAALRYRRTPAAYFADMEGPLSFGPPPPPSRMHWLSPPQTTPGLEYDSPVHYTGWDFLNEGIMMPDGWAQQRPLDAGVHPTALLTPSIEANMGLLVDMPLATLTSPESDASVQPPASGSDPLVELSACESKDGNHQVAPESPGGPVSPTTAGGRNEGTPYQTMHVARDGPPPRTLSPPTPLRPAPAVPQEASRDQGIPTASLHQRLLDLQGRLCTASATADLDGGQVEKLFEESEVLLDIMGRIVAGTPDDARRLKESGGPPSERSPPGGEQKPSGPSLSSASLSSSPSSSVLSVRADTAGQGPVSLPVMSLIALTCYLCLLQRYDQFLRGLRAHLQHARQRTEPINRHQQTACQGAGARSGMEDEGQAGLEGGKGQREQHNVCDLEDRAGCQGAATAAAPYGHMGKFQLFKSVELNAAYLVPLTSRIIERLHLSMERGLVSQAAVDYREEQRWASGHHAGAGAGGRQPSLPQIAWFAVHSVTDMHTRVLNTVYSVEKAVFTAAG